MTSWPHKIKILTAARENARNQRQNFSQLSLFHVNLRICLEYFVQNSEDWFIFNSAHNPWNLPFRQILIIWKPLSLLKLIFKAIEFWQTTEFTIFQEALFLTFAFGSESWSDWIRAVFIKIFYCFIKLSYLWGSHAFSK